MLVSHPPRFRICLVSSKKGILLGLALAAAGTALAGVGACICGCGLGCCCVFGALLPPSSSVRMLSRRDSTPATACDRNEPHLDEDLFGAAMAGARGGRGSIVLLNSARSFLYGMVSWFFVVVVVVATSQAIPPQVNPSPLPVSGGRLLDPGARRGY